MSGWTALTIHAEDDDIEEEIDRELREKYTGSEPYAATGHAERTVQVGRNVYHESVAKEFAKEFPRADRIIVVSANDTTNSGNGSLFRVTLSKDGSPDERFNKHPIKEIDTKEGHQGARGNDVTGYFRDEYDTRGYSTWEA
jgi:hypothetical protein